MRELMYFVDCDRDRTFINRIDLKDGKCLPPKRIEGVLTKQSLDLIYLIKNDFYKNVGMCTKIIFDEFGYGRGLKEIFIRDMYYERDFRLHTNGDITSPYYDEVKKKKEEEEPFADFKWRKLDE